MNELSAMYKIPEGKTASKILKIYLEAPNSYELERLKTLYTYESSRNKSPEVERILDTIELVLAGRNSSK